MARKTMLESTSNKTLQLALFQATCKPTRIIDRSFARIDCGTLYHGPRASGSCNQMVETYLHNH
jgi:hypothetical protein